MEVGQTKTVGIGLSTEEN